MTPHEKVLAEWKKNNPRRKGIETHYANGKPKVQGKTQKQIKEDDHAKFKESFANRLQYKTDTSSTAPHEKAMNWAMDVHKARVRNQKFSSEHYSDKGYKEGYR